MPPISASTSGLPWTVHVANRTHHDIELTGCSIKEGEKTSKSAKGTCLARARLNTRFHCYSEGEGQGSIELGIVLHSNKASPHPWKGLHCFKFSNAAPTSSRLEQETPWQSARLVQIPVPDSPEKHASSLDEPPMRALSRLAPSGDVEILLVPTRNTAAFLSQLPDAAPLTSLCLPGTHQSLALYGWPVSTCQSRKASISKQLDDGIRYIDVRLAPRGRPEQECLMAFHGITNERIDFEDVLRQCWDFLDGRGARETIVMSIKQESGDQPIFIRTLFERYVKPTSNYDKRSVARWYLQNRVPTLGEARGKIVMLSRFVIDGSYGYPGGISPPIWPNNFKGIFEYRLASGQVVKTQDWYDIKSLASLADKSRLISDLCEQGGRDANTLALNYCNGSSFPLALPPAVAKGFLGSDGGASQSPLASISLAVEGIDVRLRNQVATLLLGSEQQNAAKHRHQTIEGLRVIFALDYYDFIPDLVPLLIEANYR